MANTPKKTVELKDGQELIARIDLDASDSSYSYVLYDGSQIDDGEVD